MHLLPKHAQERCMFHVESIIQKAHYEAKKKIKKKTDGIEVDANAVFFHPLPSERKK
jgi:hypothetical protein